QDNAPGQAVQRNSGAAWNVSSETGLLGQIASHAAGHPTRPRQWAVAAIGVLKTKWADPVDLEQGPQLGANFFFVDTRRSELGLLVGVAGQQQEPRSGPADLFKRLQISGKIVRPYAVVTAAVEEQIERLVKWREARYIGH